MKTEVYQIEGMECAACSSAVERVTRRIDGVSESSVNLTTAKLTITYDEARVTEDEICRAVENAGFHAKLYNPDADMDRKTAENNKGGNSALIRLIIAAAFCIPLLYISMGHMLPFELPLPEFLDMHKNPMNFALAQLCLTVPVLICGYKFFTVGIKLLWKRHPNMDSLVAVGTGSAFIYSVVMTFSIPHNHDSVHYLYYESAAVVITLIMLGKYFESRSKRKTSEAIRKLMELAPATVILLKDGEQVETAVENVRPGDYILIKPGMGIALDGTIVKGRTSVDESMLTGESIPVDKEEGDFVIGGSMNFNGAIEVRVERVGKDTTLAGIIRIMEEAQGRKAPIAKLADVVAGYFVPTVLLIAMVSALLWLVSGNGAAFSLQIFVSVLVIACPCALGLATPTAIMVGTGLAANHGILIKSGEALERAHKIDTVVLDKTGTVTNGTPVLTEIVAFEKYDRQEILRLAASCEAKSEHPLAAAIVNAAAESEIPLVPIKTFNSITGFGICADTEDGRQILVGNRRLMEDNNIGDAAWLTEQTELYAEKGYTPVFVAVSGSLCGIVCVADTVKATSREAIEKLKGLKLDVILLTGDNRQTALHIAGAVGIDNVLAEVLPEDKAKKVEELQLKGRSVMMVGDGINDAPALAQADVGTAIGSGSDIAIESADIVLMKSDLRDVYKAVAISRETIKNIKQNLFWAFFYNCLGIPIAAGVLHIFGGPLLNPMLAGLAMSFSSVTVVGNALRLKNKKI